jgi:hypothetical protein
MENLPHELAVIISGGRRYKKRGRTLSSRSRNGNGIYARHGTDRNHGEQSTRQRQYRFCIVYRANGQWQAGSDISAEGTAVKTARYTGML